MDSSMGFLLIALSAMLSLLLLTLLLWRLQHKQCNSSSTVSKYYNNQYGDTAIIANVSCGSGATTYLTTANPTPTAFPMPVMKYDAFISYSMADEQFVFENLIPTLEKEHKYRLCLLYRDFDRTISPDRQHVDNELIDAMEKSHRILTIYSKDFVNKEWEQIRIRTAYQWLSHCKRRKSIVIMLDDTIPTDHALIKCMRMNLCYRYNDALFWDNLLTAMPGVYYSLINNGACINVGNTVANRQHFGTLENGRTMDDQDVSSYDTIDEDLINREHNIQPNRLDHRTTIVPSLLI